MYYRTTSCSSFHSRYFSLFWSFPAPCLFISLQSHSLLWLYSLSESTKEEDSTSQALTDKFNTFISPSLPPWLQQSPLLSAIHGSPVLPCLKTWKAALFWRRLMTVKHSPEAVLYYGHSLCYFSLSCTSSQAMHPSVTQSCPHASRATRATCAGTSWARWGICIYLYCSSSWNRWSPWFLGTTSMCEAHSFMHWRLWLLLMYDFSMGNAN